MDRTQRWGSKRSDKGPITASSERNDGDRNEANDQEDEANDTDDEAKKRQDEVNTKERVSNQEERANEERERENEEGGGRTMRTRRRERGQGTWKPHGPIDTGTSESPALQTNQQDRERIGDVASPWTRQRAYR